MPQTTTPTERALMARINALEQQSRDNAHNQQKIWTDPTGIGGDRRVNGVDGWEGITQPVQGAVAIAGYLTQVCAIDGITGYGIAVFDEQLGTHGGWCLVQCPGAAPAAPICGVAYYTSNFTFGPLNDWNPDFSNLVVYDVEPTDTIGCIVHSDLFEIPQGWYWDADILVAIHSAIPPPVGEFVTWSVQQNSIFSPPTAIAVPMIDSSGEIAQTLTLRVRGMNGSAAGGIYTGEHMVTNFGTEFTITGMEILVTALSPFECASGVRILV